MASVRRVGPCMIRSLLVLVALGLSAASPRPAAAAAAPARKVARPPKAAKSPVGSRIAARARQLIGVPLRSVDGSVPDDCTGLARLAYASAGIHLMEGGGRAGDNGVMSLFRKASGLGAVRYKHPKPGDLVFFRETYDRNRDGLRNDGLTHVAVVERVEARGQLTLVHRGSKGVARTRMNLRQAATHRDPRSGALINDYLRRGSGAQRALLTAELFAGFASPEPWLSVRRARTGSR